jgi:glycine/D-amino acid oxidase-like deaminating enzyme/nitrite reductase/ring-hydroxylating ferredoxin subunit
MTTPPEPGDHRDTSYWHATVEPAGLEPAIGSLDVDVAVIGGGILGLTTATLALEAGLNVAVLEALDLGSGTTGGTTGKVTSQNGTRLSQLTHSLGAAAATTYATAAQRGIERFDGLVDRYRIECGHEVAPAHLVALSGRQTAEVAAEADASRAAGLQVIVDGELTELDFAVAGSLTIPDQRQMHAVAYLHGLATAIHAGGGRVHERSRVVDVAPTRGARRWRVTTEQAVVSADHVVVATRLPTHRDARITFGRTKPTSSVGIAARMPGAAPRGMYLFKGSRDWSIRSSRTAAAGEHLVAVGMSESTGAAAALRPRTDPLADWARQRFGIGEVEHRWMAQDQQPSDGRPFVGNLWGEGIWTATGFGKWGLSLGTAASELLVDLMTGVRDPYDGFFSTSRIEQSSGWRTLLRANLRVGALFAGDRVRSLPRSLVDLGAGEGRVIRHGRTPVAVSRDTAGELRAVAATCTHLGCLVRWNQEERTWDCGCHGSRFAPDGEVLEAPATRPLRPIDLRGEG